jgi:hypothetical protein
MMPADWLRVSSSAQMNTLMSFSEWSYLFPMVNVDPFQGLIDLFPSKADAMLVCVLQKRNHSVKPLQIVQFVFVCLVCQCRPHRDSDSCPRAHHWAIRHSDCSSDS